MFWSAANTQTLAPGQQPDFAVTPENKSGQEPPNAVSESNSDSSVEKKQLLWKIPVAKDEYSSTANPLSESSETLRGDLPQDSKTITPKKSKVKTAVEEEPKDKPAKTSEVILAEDGRAYIQF